MKTAISLPDEVFEDAEKLARRMKMSRSALFAEAVAEYVARHEADSVTEAMNGVADSLDTRLDSPVKAAARTLLGRTEW